MPMIMNATEEEQVTRAHGNIFRFKPNQIKHMTDSLAYFMVSKRFGQGFVALSEKFEDPQYGATPEGEKELAEAKAKGIKSYLEEMRRRYMNNKESLRQDLKSKNIDTDPKAFMAEGELHAVRILAKYKKAGSDQKQKIIDEITELEKGLDEE